MMHEVSFCDLFCDGRTTKGPPFDLMAIVYGSVVSGELRSSFTFTSMVLHPVSRCEDGLRNSLWAMVESVSAPVNVARRYSPPDPTSPKGNLRSRQSANVVRATRPCRMT